MSDTFLKELNFFYVQNRNKKFCDVFKGSEYDHLIDDMYVQTFGKLIRVYFSDKYSMCHKNRRTLICFKSFMFVPIKLSTYITEQ